MIAELKKIAAVSSITGLCLVFLFNSINLFAATSQDSTVVNINIQDNICLLNVLVNPEKRIPDQNNWSTIVTLEISDVSGIRVGKLEGRSGSQGLAVFDICTQNVQLEDNKIYNIFVRGLSHLRKYFPGFRIQLGVAGINDFSTDKKVLLAGETSVIFDNYINSLDLSTQAKNFRRTDDEKNDLNRDKVVNALDISNTAFNFRKLGD